MNLFFTVIILFVIAVVINYFIKNKGNRNKKDNEINGNEKRFEGNLERLPLEIYVEQESFSMKEVEIDKVLLKIEDELFLDNINTEIKEDEISWIDNFGAENSVSSYMTATSENMIAWWQCNEVGKDSVRIKLESGIIMNWRPSMNRVGMGMLGCTFIRFFSHFLIVTYNDKHTDRIFAINTKDFIVEEIEFYGRYERIKQIDDEIFVSKSLTNDILKMRISEKGIKSEMVTSQ